MAEDADEVARRADMKDKPKKRFLAALEDIPRFHYFRFEVVRLVFKGLQAGIGI